MSRDKTMPAFVTINSLKWGFNSKFIVIALVCCSNKKYNI